MNADDLIDKATHEIKALTGDETKDKYFERVNEFPDAATAKRNFPDAVKRLLNVNKWTEESGIKSAFQLHDKHGNKSDALQPEEGDYINILLPGLPMANWVQVKEVRFGKDFAEFTVQPCPDPKGDPDKTAHFFDKNSKSIFRVEVVENKIRACEIGIDEKINNQDEAGLRAIPNTIIAEAGWNGMQQIQWQSLADFWAGLKDADNIEE